MLWTLVLFTLLLKPTFARLLTDASTLRPSYDFVIVGAGTAGSVMANRLSANSSTSVLVIEAGGDDTGIEALQIPFTAPSCIENASLIWDYSTTPQRSLNNRVINFERGRVLGGSSSVNFLFYTRGSRDDFDRFAQYTGQSKWSWNAMFPYMLKSEGFVLPVDGHNTTNEISPADHDKKGPLRTTVANFPLPFDSRITATSKANPGLYPYNEDPNSGQTLGSSFIQSTAGHGIRSSAATAFLHPALSRPNLDVIINSQVTQLVNTGTKQSIELRKVNFIVGGKNQTVHANKEVILSAGAVNTPHLLLLSGVGDPSQLSAHGIRSLVDLPGVGKSFQDHPLIAFPFSTNSTQTLDATLRNTTALASLQRQWQKSKTGMFSGLSGNQLINMRLPKNSSIFKSNEDPSAGSTSAHLELVVASNFLSFSMQAPSNGSYLSIVASVASSASRGSITLASANPFDAPLIDPGYLTNDFDVYAIVQAAHMSDAYFAKSQWAGMDIKRFGSFAQATTDDALKEYARANVVGTWHPCCTAKMGKTSDETAVVDPQLLVKGVKGLRVVDASVFPYIPSAHLQAPTYAIAERAADLVKEAWGL